MRSGYKDVSAMALGLLGLPTFRQRANHVGPGRRTSFNRPQLQPMTDAERKWRDRGLQPDSRESMRRAGRLTEYVKPTTGKGNQNGL